MGCYVQTAYDRIEEDDSIDLAIGNNQKKDIVEILEKYLADRESKTLGGTTIPDIAHTCQYEEMQLRQTAEHTRAYIKIQDGCNQFCSYCAIPLARGRVRSRKEEDILREIKGMVDAGYREVVLTGIHISSYGIDFERNGAYAGSGTLIDLIEQIHGIEGLQRIRLGSLEPRIVTEETVRRLAALPKLCPHFHLSLQSGCDDTLKRMNRKYTTGEYYESVERLRSAFDCPAVTTDVIVGFPRETEEEFARTKEFLEKVGFYEMHIFKYSKRRGTAAAEMPDQVPEEVKTRRSGELFELERRQSIEFRRRYIGREAEILPEETKRIGGREYLLGYTKDYVRIAVSCEEGAAKAVPGRLISVQVKDFLTEEILLA